MRLRLSDWASIAEIASGIAVVITLLFLVIGIRESTDVNRAAVYDRNIDSLNEWRATMLANPPINRIYIAYVDGEVPSPVYGGSKNSGANIE